MDRRTGTAGEPAKIEAGAYPTPPSWQHYFTAVMVVALYALLSWIFEAFGLNNTNLVMIFLAGVAVVVARCGHGPAIAAAVLGVLVFDYFFVEPVFGFAPSDTQYFFTLSVVLGIGLFISERLTGAAWDRLTHRCHILETKGESYRLQDAKRRRRRTG